MLENALTGFERQVEAGEFRVALFEFIDHAQRLQVVFKSAKFLHAGIQCILPGMAKGCMSQVMRQRNAFRQVFIYA